MADYVTEFAKQGLGYILTIPELSTSLSLTHLRRSSGEMNGDLTIKCRIEGVRTVGGILHSARFNMSSSATRERLAKYLTARVKRMVDKDLDFDHFLDELCIKTLEKEETGEPITEVGFGEVATFEARYAVYPLMSLNEPALLYGAGGSGKSLIALSNLVAYAAGRELVPGIAPAGKGNCLLLDYETSWDRVNQRLQALAAGAGIPVPHGIFYRRCRKPLLNDAEELAAFVEEKEIKLVVIDSAAQAIGPQGEYGDANEGALRLFEAIRYLGTVSTLIVDHVSKQELVLAGKRGRVPYGSVYKINYSRRAWEVRKSEPAPDGSLRLELHDFKGNDDATLAPIALRIGWKPGNISFAKDEITVDTDGEGPVRGSRTLADRLEELLADAQMTAPKLAETLNLNPATVRAVLSRGPQFEKDGDRWRLARPHLMRDDE